jgi:RNA polymerase sigma-70 factor, ECF subfamily
MTGIVPAARGVRDPAEFAHSADALRPQLLAHCYRMLGSVDEAEDLVQETYLRAWRSYARFEGRSSVRAWLYRIATNACLTALDRRRRRALPSGLGPPATDPSTSPAPAGPGVAWIQPIPDAIVGPARDDPADVVFARESLRLALIASLQILPARQRAVLLLRDVLGLPSAEVAEMLGMSTPAVKSALQRARVRLDDAAPVADDVDSLTDAQERALLEQYIAAIENADAQALEQLLRDDATLEATPTRMWFAGRRHCVPFLVAHVLGSAGDWRMSPTRANGQPAAVAYLRGDDGEYNPYGVVLLTAGTGGITGIHAFGEPALVARFTGSRP